MTDKKIKLEDIIRGEWKNLPEDDRKFVERVCLKKFAALRNRPDDGCDTDDRKIKHVIGELWGHYQDVGYVKGILENDGQGVVTNVNPDIEFLCEHPQNKPDFLYISPEGNRTLTIDVAGDISELRAGDFIVPPTRNGDFVAAFSRGGHLWIVSRDDYQIAYEFDLFSMYGGK